MEEENNTFDEFFSDGPTSTDSVESTETFDSFFPQVEASPILTSTPVGSLGIGDSKYDSYDDPVEMFYNLNQVRAERQGGWAEFGNATLGGILSGVLTAAETAGLIIEAPFSAIGGLGKEDNLDQWEYNAFSGKMKEWKESLLQEHLPIYRKNPGKMIDFHDSAFYWEAFRGVLDSAIGFGATGMGAGAAVKAAGAGLRGARLGAWTRAMGAGLEQGQLGRITSAFITNYGEGKMMALELYEKAHEDNMAQFMKNNPNATEDELKEFELDSKIAAGKRANHFMMANKTMILTDYFQLGPLFKGVTNKTDNLITPTTFRSVIGEQVKRAPVEAFEENIQNVFQMEGIQRTRMDLKEKGYNIGEGDYDNLNLGQRVVEFATSEQAMLESAMGLFGGPVQYTITQLPFLDTAAEKERMAVQETIIKESNDYVNGALYQQLTRKGMEQKAEEMGPDMSKAADDLAFTEIVIKNFANGTTGKLVEAIREMENVEEEKKQEKINLLNELEQEYLNYEEYYSRELMMDNRARYKFNSTIMGVMQNKKAEILKDINRKLNDYNNGMDHQYSLQEVLSGEASNMVEDYLALELAALQMADVNIKPVATQLIEDERQFSQLKMNDELIEDAYTVQRNGDLTSEQKQNKLRTLAKKSKGDYVKQLINNLAKLEQDKEEKVLKEDKEPEEERSTAVPKKTKQEKKKVSVKGKKNQTKEVEEPVYENTKEIPIVPAKKASEIDVEEQNQKLMDTISKQVQIGGADEYLDNLLKAQESGESWENIIKQADALVQSGQVQLDEEQLAQLEKLKDQMAYYETRYGDKIDNAGQEEDIDKNLDLNELDKQVVNEGVKSTKDVSNATDPIIPAEEVNEIMSESQQVATPKEDNGKDLDVKVVFTVGSKAYKKYLASADNKEGDQVEFVLAPSNKNSSSDELKAIADLKAGKSNAFVAENVPIRVIFKGDDKNYSYLFKPTAEDAWDAYDAEMELRQNIVNALVAGKKALGKVTYQYSGGITNGKNKKIGDIFGKDNKLIASNLLYVDRDGRLKYAKNRKLASNFTKVIEWPGAVFLQHLSPNGKYMPIKMNVKALSDQEQRLIKALYLHIVQTKGFQEKALSKEKSLWKLLSKEDQDYLGPKATVMDAIEHLMYNDSTNPNTGIRFNKGVLSFGGKKLTKTELRSPGKLKAFENFISRKKRAVNLKKFQEGEFDEKYVNLILNNGILLTDVEKDADGNIFTSVSADFTNPVNRYLSKALYVKFDDSVGKDKKSSDISRKVNMNEAVNKTYQKKKKTEKAQPSEKAVRRDAEMQAALDKLNKNPKC